MIKLLSAMTAGLLVLGTAFAGEHADNSAKGQSDSGKMRMACSIPTYNLKLTDAQRQKMAAVIAEHHKTGCTAESEAKFVAQAKEIMTPAQFAKFKAEYDKSPKTSM